MVYRWYTGIQIIPKSWINDDGTKVRWPLFSSQGRFDQAVKKMQQWQESWPEFPLKGIIGSTSSYEKARQKMRDAEIFSDVSTGSERDEILKRTRKQRAKYSRSSEDTESEDERIVKVPPFPNFSGMSSIKKIKTEKKEGNRIAVLKQYEENVPMRIISSTKFSSTMKKGSQIEENKNGSKLVG